MCGILKIKMNKIGPKIFPCIAKEVPTPVAINRKVPQKKESPNPASGPIKDVLILSIAVTSNSGSSLFSSSIAAVIPKINVTICGVVLKNSRCRFKAAAISSFD